MELPLPHPVPILWPQGLWEVAQQGDSWAHSISPCHSRVSEPPVASQTTPCLGIPFLAPPREGKPWTYESS